MSDQTPQDPQPTVPTYLPPATTGPTAPTEPSVPPAPSWPPPPVPSTPLWPPSGPPTEPAPKRGLGLILGAIALVVVLGAGFFLFQATRSGENAEAQPLALSFTQGQSETYVIGMTMDGTISAPQIGTQPLTMDLSETVTWRVTDVDADGVATVEVSISDLSGSANGIAIPPIANAPSIQMRIARDGRILTAGGLALSGAGDTNGFGFPGMGQFTPLLPDKPVAPGDTWDKTFSQKMPFGTGDIEYTTHSRFLGYEDVNGAKAAAITTDLTVPLDFTVNLGDLLAAMGDTGTTAGGSSGLSGLDNATLDYGGQGHFTMKAWVDLDAKQLLKSESQGSFDMTMAYSGLAELPSGTISFTGDFTQSVEKR